MWQLRKIPLITVVIQAEFNYIHYISQNLHITHLQFLLSILNIGVYHQL